MLEAGVNEKYNIICLSNQLWDYILPTNKKHVMGRVAKQGHNVLFVDPPINTGRVFARQLLKKKWNLRRLFSGIYKNSKLTVFSPLDFLPIQSYLSKLHIKRIKKIISKVHDKNKKTILWIYHVEIPGLKNYIEQLNYDLLVYDCVDNYSAFPRYNTQEKKDKINGVEDYLVRSADLVFATAPGLVERLKKLNSNTHYTPNVGDYEKFKNVPNLKNNLPDDIKNIKKPIIGFTGAVDEYKFDRKLFKQIISDYPNYSFVVIGPLGLKDRETNLKEMDLEGFNNVHFMGSREFSVIQNYLAAFDVFIIPFALNDYTVGGCFPIKFHDSLSAGLPVVVTNMPAYKPFADVCYISKNYNEFSQNIRRALEEDSMEKINQRQTVAMQNSWDVKVQNLLSLIKETLHK